ncbi:glycogen debranching protein [Candidatus Falkowbacteria bacterium]|nr:glycogen debranching protein [Candidatus Falkowbacteria bacterium]
MGKNDQNQAYEQAVLLLKDCLSNNGFLASPVKRFNYYRVFSRDGIVMGLSACLTEDKKLLKGFYKTLKTLKRYQGRQGQIPSNVDPGNKKVSYGRTTGRVDATLWFVIGCGQYYKRTKDKKFLKEFYPAIEKCINLLEAWEYNQKGFIFVPPTGDWADEYIQSGYVLYDQVLYYRALVEQAFISKEMKKSHQAYKSKAEELKIYIRKNFWYKSLESDKYIYHDNLYKRRKRKKDIKNYWLPCFSPVGYQYFFDSLANILASIFSIADEKQAGAVDKFIAKKFAKRTDHLLPAFYPVIGKNSPDWEKLKTSFSFKFKNKKYEYFNGGLWPFITAFYAVDLAYRGKRQLALRYLEGAGQANSSKNWRFSEFMHGKSGKPMGTAKLGWNAAATILAYKAFDNKDIFI